MQTFLSIILIFATSILQISNTSTVPENKPRSSEISQTCSLKLAIKEDMSLELQPLLTQTQAEAIPPLAATDHADYYNQNEDVFKLFYSTDKQNKSEFFTIACENRTGGKEYIADGWGWYTSKQKAVKSYTLEEVKKAVPWSIFNDTEFQKNVTDIQGIVANNDFNSRLSVGSYTNTFYLKFKYKGKPYRFDGQINPTKYSKYGATNFDVFISK